MQPEISIIIPTYQRPQETARAIRSVLAQPELAVEVVVVDDASPAPFALPSDLASHQSIRLICLNENRGAGAARNAGVDVARAEYIAFLDSDDFYLPGALAQRLAWLRTLPSNRPILAASVVWRWQPGRGARLSRPFDTADPEAFAAGCWYFPGSSALMSRRTWDIVGPLDPALRRLEDLDWGIRLGLAGGELRVAKWPSAVIRQSRPASRALVASAAKQILRNYGPGGERALAASAYRQLEAYLALELANASYGAGRYGELAMHLLRSWAKLPRRSMHLRSWWTERAADASEFMELEALASTLLEAGQKGEGRKVAPS